MNSSTRLSTTCIYRDSNFWRSPIHPKLTNYCKTKYLVCSLWSLTNLSLHEIKAVKSNLFHSWARSLSKVTVRSCETLWRKTEYHLWILTQRITGKSPFRKAPNMTQTRNLPLTAISPLTVMRSQLSELLLFKTTKTGALLMTKTTSQTKFEPNPQSAESFLHKEQQTKKAELTKISSSSERVLSYLYKLIDLQSRLVRHNSR